MGAGVGYGLPDFCQIGGWIPKEIDLVLDVRDRRRDVVKDAPCHHLHLVRKRDDAAHETPDDPDAEREEDAFGDDRRERDEDVASQRRVDLVRTDGPFQQPDPGESSDRRGDDHRDRQERDRRPVDALGEEGTSVAFTHGRHILLADWFRWGRLRPD